MYGEVAFKVSNAAVGKGYGACGCRLFPIRLVEVWASLNHQEHQ